MLDKIKQLVLAAMPPLGDDMIVACERARPDLMRPAGEANHLLPALR